MIDFLIAIDIDPDSVEKMSEILAEEDKIEIDFSKLSKKLLGLTKAQQEEAVAAFVERINALAVERESIAPNLKAIGKAIFLLLHYLRQYRASW